jgi:hypothetical protein
MPAVMSRTRGLAVGMCLLALLAFDASAYAAKSTKTVNATSQLNALIRQTSAISGKSVSNRSSLLGAVRNARKTARRNPCVALKSLAAYRKALHKAKLRRGVRGAKSRSKLTEHLASLSAQSALLSRKLLADKRTKRCGGGVVPSTLSSAKTTVLKSDVNGMRLRVRLPGLRFGAQSGGGKAWTQISLPDTHAPGAPGTPGIPVVGGTFAVPDGAKVSVKASASEAYTIDGVDLYPSQPDVVDAANEGLPNFFKAPFASKPFDVDRSAYAHRGLFPAQPADGGVLGEAGDVTLGDLRIPAAQYDAAAHKLKVLNSVDVDVTFSGGSKTFSPHLDSPWEQAQRRLLGGVINASIVKGRPELINWHCGEEMLVITSAVTRASADQLAASRNAAGLRTAVVETGAGAGQIGTTAVAIQAFIRGQLKPLLCIHPSYVAIVGDDKLVPTFSGVSEIPSDLPYSMKNDSDELPDIAVGRIIANDATEASAAITKIIGYETTPPTGSFLTKATVAAMFQDQDGPEQVNDGQENRTFIQFAETVSKGLEHRGVSVDRIYHDSPETTPLRFNDGTELPASLKKPTFAWNGTGTDVTNAWNEGRFMVVHRDHGYSDGWGDPSFGTGEVNALTNGTKLPVVLSINCSSGAYDYDDTSFAQSALVKPDGGAVGVFGDTRDSPTWHNSQIALGFVDALLPSVLPSEGPATKQRMGDALINGKLRLAGIAPPASDGNTRAELYLWHYFGDPSMQMWGGGETPIAFNPARFKAIYKADLTPPGPDPGPKYGVQVTLPKELAGQSISLLRGGEVVGKALAGDGSVTIPASFGDGSVKPGELKVAVEGVGAQPVSVPVEGVPPAPTTLTQVCPAASVTDQPLTVTGTLSTAPAGSKVTVTFAYQPVLTRPAVHTVVKEVSTDASGAWSASITPTANEPGTWVVSSKYAGDSTYAGSEGGPCQVSVTPPPPIVE